MHRKAKVVILGEGRVGKTSLLLRYVKGEFSDKQESTFNASYLDKEVRNSREEVVKLSLWDTAGQEIFNSITPIYYREADAALVVYDITFAESFNKVQKWME
jgi:Ras-related protein Rab-21